MEQRRVRLGDIVDDYCPRERRVTNHAVVAMIEDAIRLTRCTACDAEHPYKGARVPRRKKLDAPGALYAAVPVGRSDEPEESAVQGPLAAAPPTEADPAADADRGPDRPVAANELPAAVNGPAPMAEAPEDGPVRRPLIRATLPRPEGQQTTRQAPEFTMRQSGVRGGRLIDGDSRGNTRGGQPSNNGPRPPKHLRHGSRPGHGPGQGPGRSHGSPQGASRYDRSQGHSRGQRPGLPAPGGKKRSH